MWQAFLMSMALTWPTDELHHLCQKIRTRTAYRSCSELANDLIKMNHAPRCRFLRIQHFNPNVFPCFSVTYQHVVAHVTLLKGMTVIRQLLCVLRLINRITSCNRRFSVAEMRCGRRGLANKQIQNNPSHSFQTLLQCSRFPSSF